MRARSPLHSQRRQLQAGLLPVEPRRCRCIALRTGTGAMAAAACLVHSDVAYPPTLLAPLLRDALSRHGPLSRVYVYLEGTGGAANASLIVWLEQLYGMVGDFAPRLDVVPLLEFAGWDQSALTGVTLDALILCGKAVSVQPDAAIGVGNILSKAGALAALEGVKETLHAGRVPVNTAAAAATPLVATNGQPEHSIPAATSQQQAATVPAAASTAAGLHPITAPHVDALPSHTLTSTAAFTAAAPPPGAPPDQPLGFEAVAVGGTFDRLHAGHRLLLAVTALVATERVYVGVTADELLAKKSHREWLQSYEQRKDAAVSFMLAVRPTLSVAAGALRDPKEPTQAELDPDMQALVVSKETLPGGDAINVGRVARRFAPLRLVVVSMVRERADGSKLSSTELREQDALARK